MSNQSQNDQSNKAIRIFRAPGMSVAVFANTSDDGRTFHKLSAQRIYKSGNSFRTSTSFSVAELPQLVLLMLRAWSYASDLEDSGKDRAKD